MSIRTTAYMLMLASLLLTSQIHAANAEWTTAASACVPDESSKDRYVLEQARFEFFPGATGEIVARCNITDPSDGPNSPPWNAMDVTFSDNGHPIDSQVKVQLRRVHQTTGASTTLATFDSNLVVAGQQLQTLPFNHVFDFTHYAYYLTLIVNRSSSSKIPRIERVRLRFLPPG